MHDDNYIADDELDFDETDSAGFDADDDSVVPVRRWLTDQQPDENGLYEHASVKVDKGQTSMRIDKFLSIRLENCSRNRIQTAVDEGNVFVNGERVKASYKIKPLDNISIRMAYPKYDSALTPEDIPIDIMYEDDDVIVVNKEAGMVVHPGHGNYSGTLVNALTFHLKDNPMFQSGDQRPGLVHRIDKNTSGILVVGKNEQACNSLSKQFFDHTTQRRYVALVWGNFDEDEGTITGNIGRNPRNRHQMYVFADGSEGKHAVTHYRVLKRYGYVTLIECRLETGRTHQIRVHMQYVGHPLFNDERYGGDKILKGTTFSKYRQFIENCFELMPRHALHARMLGFTHPSTGEQMCFESPLPADFQAVLAKWDTYTAAAQTANV
ncbi:MAG: RluA family pseudouridine synthase [Alistipes sp.]